MKTDRRQFSLGITAALLGLGANPRLLAQDAADHSAKSPAAVRPTYFFKNPTFEYTFQISLGRAYHSGGDVGKVLYLSRQVEDGNFESAYLAFKRAGDEARAEAADSASRGHKESARQAYLWAQNYYDSSTYFVDGSKDPTRFLPTWELLYDCWLHSLALFDPPIEAVKIPYENTELHGFFLRGRSNSPKRPLLILVNGSDGSLLDMWLQGGAGALARGYDCLTFDGPGQGYALWKQNLHFRPDWEKVIAPVVDYALSRPEVDPKRIALQGISQGGFWVPRALAFERRIAAGIADPGVVDVVNFVDRRTTEAHARVAQSRPQIRIRWLYGEVVKRARKNVFEFPHEAVRFRVLLRRLQCRPRIQFGGCCKEYPLPHADNGTGQRIVLARPVAPTLRLADVSQEAGAFLRKRWRRSALRTQRHRSARSPNIQLAG